MPRIPSSADVNPVGGSAGRLPSVRADAADFGLSIAQGLSAFGQGLGDVGGRLSAEARREAAEQEAEEEPSKKNQLAETTGLVRTQQIQAKARMIGNDLIGGMERDAQTPGLAAQDVIKEFDRSVKNLVAALPSEWQALVTTAIAPVREGVAVRARGRAHNLAVEGVMQDTEEILQSLTMLALREPEAAEIYLAEGEALLQSHVRTGALTQEQFAAQRQVFRRSLYTKLLRSQSAIDAVADLKAGVYDEALDDPALKELLLRESTRRLELERAQGIAGTNWLVARARRGATTQDALAERSARFLGGAGSAEVQKGLDRVRRVSSELEALRYAPKAMLWQGMAELPLAWEAEDAREVLEVQEEFRVQAEEMLRRRREDPAAYVMNLPGISEAFSAAEVDPALLAEAIAERLAAQEAMGLTPDEQNALTLAERRQIIAGLQQLAPEQRAAALQELQQAYGEQAAAVVADLAEAGISVDEVLAGDPSGGPEVSGQLARLADTEQGTISLDGNLISEMAEKLIAGARASASRRETQQQVGRGGAREFPPLPRREPDSAVPAADSTQSALEAGREGDEPVRLPAATDEWAVLEKYGDLMVGERARELDKRAKSLAFKDFVSDLERQADDANASTEIRELFVKLTLHKMLGDNLGAERARELASAELGLDDLGIGATGESVVEQPEKAASSASQTPKSETIGMSKDEPVSAIAAEKELDRLLLVLGINPVLREGDPAFVLPLIKEVMQVRAYAAAGEYERIQDLRNRIKGLDGTEHRFLYQPLTAKLNRALSRPETAPWALSDGEVYSVFKALGGSASALAVGASTMAVLEKFVLPARFLKWASSLAGIQQHQMQSLYEAELYRRGIFRAPAIQP